MRSLFVVMLAVVATAAPAVAADTERGFVSGIAGFATSPDGTSGNVLGEAAVRVAPHVLVFGGVGKFHNVQPSDVQPAVDQAIAAISTADAVGMTATARG